MHTANVCAEDGQNNMNAYQYMYLLLTSYKGILLIGQL